MKKIVTGNANQLGKDHGQWIMGYGFKDMPSMENETLRIKWSHHKKGERREEVHSISGYQTITILVHGHFIQQMNGRSYEQSIEGDFVYCPANTPHTWEAIEDSMMITIQFQESK